MNLSIIIPTKNCASLLKACLTRLTPQLSRQDEVIVVDNNSTDDTALVVQSFARRSPIRYIVEKNPGASYARNAGFSRATKEGVAFIDDDSMVDASWVREVKRILTERRSRRPEAVYQGQVIQTYAHQGIYEFFHLGYFSQQSANHGMSKEAKKFSPLAQLIVCNVFSYREVFASLDGPFAADLFPYIGEELDMVCRLIIAKKIIRYAPTVRITHAKQRVRFMRSLLSAYMYGRSDAIVRRMYFSNPSFLLSYEGIQVDKRQPSPIRSDRASSYPFIEFHRFWYEFWTRFAYTTGQVIYSTIPMTWVRYFHIPVGWFRRPKK